MSTEKTFVNNIDKIYTADASAFAKAYLDYLKQVIDGIDRQEVAAFIADLLRAREHGANIFFIGNGGSAATASHFANDIAIGTDNYDKPFKAISLTDNMPIVTAIGNDFGYEDIFLRQLMVLASPGDLLVAISASGNSPNLLSAIEYANVNGIKTIAITAFDGGKMRSLAASGIHVPTEPKEYGPAEDAHMILDHLVGAYLMRFIKHA